DPHDTGLAVDGERHAAAADLPERGHERKAVGPAHRAVSEHLAAGAEPCLDHLAVRALLAIRRHAGGRVLDRRAGEDLRREIADAPACVATGLLHRAARHGGRAAGAGGPLVRDDAGVAADDADAIERDT